MPEGEVNERGGGICRVQHAFGNWSDLGSELWRGLQGPLTAHVGIFVSVRGSGFR